MTDVLGKRKHTAFHFLAWHDEGGKRKVSEIEMPTLSFTDFTGAVVPCIAYGVRKAKMCQFSLARPCLLLYMGPFLGYETEMGYRSNKESLFFFFSSFLDSLCVTRHHKMYDLGPPAVDAAAMLPVLIYIDLIRLFFLPFFSSFVFPLRTFVCRSCTRCFCSLYLIRTSGLRFQFFTFEAAKDIPHD